MTNDEIRQAVRTRYGKYAESAGRTVSSCCSKPGASACCAGEQGIYAESELASVPSLARNLSRGCGNPVGFADLLAGEVVVDFGCGGGIDVILASRRVGKHGTVIGVDITPQMIDRAVEAAAQAGIPSSSASFRLAPLENTMLPNACADVVMSNCVINLCPNKDEVYREAFRILKPGGRLAISDILLTEPIAADLRARFESIWAGCTGGAIPEEDCWRTLNDAGFEELRVVARHTLLGAELDEMVRCPGPEYTPALLSEDIDKIKGVVGSVKFTAVKPSESPGSGLR